MKQESYIYCFLAAQVARVKIGHTTRPKTRASEAKAYSPVPLTLIGLWRGDKAQEIETHQKFEHLRRDGEWFELNQELWDYIRQMNARDYQANRSIAADILCVFGFDVPADIVEQLAVVL